MKKKVKLEEFYKEMYTCFVSEWKKFLAVGYRIDNIVYTIFAFTPQ